MAPNYYYYNIKQFNVNNKVNKKKFPEIKINTDKQKTKNGNLY